MYDLSYPRLIRHILIVAVLLSGACAAIKSADPQGPDPAELLIDLSAMPQNWDITKKGDAPDNIRQLAGASIQFAALTQEFHAASHIVYRYKSEQQAAREFKGMLQNEFSNRMISALTNWQTPKELSSYSSQVADQFHFACHTVRIKQTADICQAIGQYANYLVVFHTHVGSGFMSFEDFETILKTIDARMADIRDN